MKNKAGTLAKAVIGLVAFPLACSMPAVAQTTTSTSTVTTQDLSSLLLATTGEVTGAVISPVTMYTIAVSPLIWNGLIDVVAPYMKPYAETLRMLALKKVPRLQPVPSAPQPPAQTYANAHTMVVSFGDSMSDTGNMFDVSKALGGKGLPAAPNDRGRFSNGPVVLEAMANALNLPLLNYAFGGARSGTNNLIPVYGMQAGMLKQVRDFLDNQPTPYSRVDSQALYVLWTGPDDYYADGNIFDPKTTGVITANIRQGMTLLYQRGARHFFVPLMPDLSITPSAREHNKQVKTYLANAKQRSVELASSVTAMLRDFAKQYPQADVRTFDTFTYSQARTQQAAAEGYNVTEPCYTPPFMGLPGPVCANPDQYLFWDTNHPTAAGSLVIGTEFAKAVVGAPLPSR